MNCPRCNAEVPEGAKYCPSCGAAVAATEDKPEETKKAETSTGLEPNIAALLSYVLGWVTGIVFVIIEQKSKFVRFHAWQSIITFGVLTAAEIVLGWIPVVGVVFSSLIGLLAFVLWVILLVEAGTGKVWKVPWAGDLAEKQVGGLP